MNKSKKLLSMLTIALALSSAAPLYAEQNNSWFSWSTIGAATAVIGSFAGLGIWGWKAHTKAKKLEQDLSTAEMVIDESKRESIRRSRIEEAVQAVRDQQKEADRQTIRNQREEAAQQAIRDQQTIGAIRGVIRDLEGKIRVVANHHNTINAEYNASLRAQLQVEQQLDDALREKAELIQEKDQLIDESATAYGQIYLLRKQQQNLIQEKNALIAESAQQQQKSAKEIKRLMKLRAEAAGIARSFRHN